VIFYDGDTPTSLPSYEGLSFSYYSGADPSEYDAFIINSKGAVNEVKKLGARRIFTVYWSVDPSAFCPIKGIEQVNDVGFYGIRSKLREEWITRMLVSPSLRLTKARFAVCGTAFNMELGFVQLVNLGNYSYRSFCCKTKVNLNIVRRPHAEVYASSISRIFELASLGCCVVSNPYKGIEEWFNVGKEVLVANERALGGFNKRLRFGEDLELGSRIIKLGYKVVIFNEPLIHDTMWSLKEYTRKQMWGASALTEVKKALITNLCISWRSDSSKDSMSYCVVNALKLSITGLKGMISGLARDKDTSWLMFPLLLGIRVLVYGGFFLVSALKG
jgi:hypothetical protein